MMKALFVLLGIFILLTAGCFGPSEQDNSQAAGSGSDIPDDDGMHDDETSDSQDDNIVEGSEPGSQILEVGDATGKTEPARSQADCATRTSTCDECTTKPGCGWCKGSNSCFYGDSDGPKVSSCQDAEWAYTSEQCKGPVGGSDCSEKTNCADCLSGSGCNWCIEGSVCADSSTTAECLGGWQSEIYRCNYASR